MNGRVNQRREALVELEVSGRRRHARIPCAIDTGYTGTLVLPERLVNDLELPYAGSIMARLADGSLLELPSYETAVTWLDGTRAVLASAVLADHALVGTALLDGRRLTIDYAARSVEAAYRNTLGFGLRFTRGSCFTRRRLESARDCDAHYVQWHRPRDFAAR